jgi:2-keto-4-pentenoate hydratase/2-oxohepta-3-ene-1,7-dioic acid hydratase in catechol pathway
MRLCTFTEGNETRIGVVAGEAVVDLARAAPDLPRDMTAFLAAGERAMDGARRAAERGRELIPLGGVRLEAPVPRPRKFLGIGANYYLTAPLPGMTDAECEAIRQEQRDLRASGRQVWFNKQVSCINGPYDPIALPRDEHELYFEVELAFVIGSACRHVAVEQARDHIAGYLVCNDVTLVDLCRASPTLTLGKSHDTHGPIGPWIVTADAVGDPHALDLRAHVNGELRQAGNSRDMIFDCFELVAYASRIFTLEPGDIVTAGMPCSPIDGLAEGDVVRCEVEAIGFIENEVRRLD